MRTKALAPLAAAILALAGVYAATVLAGGSKPAIGTITTTNNAHNKVTICHATGSKTNPYVVITPDASGVIDGHYAVQVDSCGSQSYTPFDVVTGVLGRPTAPRQPPLY